MSNRKASFNGMAGLIMSLTEEEQLALMDSSDELKKFAGDRVVEIIRNIFFTPLSDNDAAESLVETIVKWRKLAVEFGYMGPVVWTVKEGFTLKMHAPKAGPCHGNFQYLQDWNFRNDKPTKNSLVLWVPRLVSGSKDKNVEEQVGILAELRQTFGLPEYHLASFGSAALLSGLILAHFKRTGERTPLKGDWTRTDTFGSDGSRLPLGGFVSNGLRCDDWLWDDNRYPFVGCFPLGVELGA